MPKRFRLHFRFNRELLRKLPRLAYKMRWAALIKRVYEAILRSAQSAEERWPFPYRS